MTEIYKGRVVPKKNWIYVPTNYVHIEADDAPCEPDLLKLIKDIKNFDCDYYQCGCDYYVGYKICVKCLEITEPATVSGEVDRTYYLNTDLKEFKPIMTHEEIEEHNRKENEECARAWGSRPHPLLDFF